MGACELLLYDGGCGLCHAAVRFALRHDRDGRLFRFAPLGGAAARALGSEAGASGETFVLVTSDGRQVVRSEAVLHVLAQIGGVWGVLAAFGRLVPRGWRDHAYDAVARVRRRLARAPSGPCPVLDARLRSRFDLAS